MHDLCMLYKKGKALKSKEIQLELGELIKEMFCESNPIPVKKALSILGLCSDEMRLPLTPSTRSEEIASLISKYSL